MAVKVTGIDTVLANLNRELKNIEGDISIGLRAAGIAIKGWSQDMTPHDTGTLVNTAFTDFSTANGVPMTRVGYTALYAPYVHEMPATYNYSKSGTGPKFLEKAVKNNTYRIIKIIQSRARV